MQDPQDRSREKDLVLTVNEYAYVNDTTKGQITTYVGPYKTSLSSTDLPVYFDPNGYKFRTSESLEKAKKTMVIAPQNFYVNLKNPTDDNLHPTIGNTSISPKLEIGKKVVIQGPCSFALFPGQMAQVIKGHQLRSNQYLIVRIYDEKSARENWSKAVVKSVEGKDANSNTLETISADTISLGNDYVIKGTEVSFYMPPTGVEVLKNSEGAYVRDAVTLERLEYCILLDEEGEKRYEKGPKVVFPKATETFISKDSSDKVKGAYRKFRAIELSDIKGIYVEVIEDYMEYIDELGSFIDPDELNIKELPSNIKTVARKKGDELFITGKQQKIYFPRSEHALIKYGNNELHYAVSIPPGRGRYVLNRITGEFRTIKGATMYLPDPRTEVMVSRLIDPNTVKLWFPGNSYDYKEQKNVSNTVLYSRNSSTAKKTSDSLPIADLGSTSFTSFDSEVTYESFTPERVGGSHNPDSIDRSNTFTPPRVISLDTKDSKYQEAISINVWSNYAIQVVSKSGNKEVVMGPTTRILDYDEQLEVLSVSCGNPKGREPVKQTVYLRINNNKVSDTFEIETKDFVKADVSLSYMVNFDVDQKDKWFDIENYTQTLTNHFRSTVKTNLKKFTIKEFYYEASEILKKLILNKSFNNGMKVVDCEILDVHIKDALVFDLIVSSERFALDLKMKMFRLNEEIDSKKSIKDLEKELADITSKHDLEDVERKIVIENKLNDLRTIRDQQNLEETIRSINKNKLIVESELAEASERKNIEDIQILIDKERLLMRFSEIEAEVKAITKKAEVFTPQLVEAIRSSSDKEFISRLTRDLAPLTVLGGGSIAEVMNNAFKGTGIESIFLGDALPELLKNTLKVKS